MKKIDQILLEKKFKEKWTLIEAEDSFQRHIFELETLSQMIGIYSVIKVRRETKLKHFVQEKSKNIWWRELNLTLYRFRDILNLLFGKIQKKTMWATLHLISMQNRWQWQVLQPIEKKDTIKWAEHRSESYTFRQTLGKLDNLSTNQRCHARHTLSCLYSYHSNDRTDHAGFMQISIKCK